MKDFPIYPHLGMTEDELAGICEELFTGDMVLQSRIEAITDYESKIAHYEERVTDHHKEVNRLEDRIDEINAELKAASRMKAETHSLIAGMKYHIKVATARIKTAHNSIERRKRQLYLSEARRRLSSLGKELKLNIGRRAAKGLGAAVIDKPNETQAAPQ
jgi:chromosome segregation ATPase